MTEITPIKPTLLGLDGKPLVQTTVDRSDIHAMPNYSPEQLLMAAGRMLRDGKSPKAIRTALNLIDVGPDAVPLSNVENAARKGLVMLNAAIAAGTETEESISLVMREEWDLKDELSPIDSEMMDPTGVNNVDKGYLEQD